MNPKLQDNLAAELTANHSLFDAMDKSLLGELVFHYDQGELSTEDAAEVAAMIEIDPETKAIYQRIQDAKKNTSSDSGAEWLGGMLDRILRNTGFRRGTSAFMEEGPNSDPPLEIAWNRVSFSKLGIAADSNQSPSRIFSVEGKTLILLLIPQADGKHLTVEVHTVAYQPSTELDGSFLLTEDGRFRIKDGKAVAPLRSGNLRFRLTSDDGNEIPLKKEL